MDREIGIYIYIYIVQWGHVSIPEYDYDFAALGAQDLEAIAYALARTHAGTKKDIHTRAHTNTPTHA